MHIPMIHLKSSLHAVWHRATSITNVWSLSEEEKDYRLGMRLNNRPLTALGTSTDKTPPPGGSARARTPQDNRDHPKLPNLSGQYT